MLVTMWNISVKLLYPIKSYLKVKSLKALPDALWAALKLDGVIHH